MSLFSKIYTSHYMNALISKIYTSPLYIYLWTLLLVKFTPLTILLSMNALISKIYTSHYTFYLYTCVNLVSLSRRMSLFSHYVNA